MVSARLEIYLIRHGETRWNAEGRYQGTSDSPLTERGIAQARKSGRLLAECGAAIDSWAIDSWQVSPLGRAQQTSEIVRSLGAYPEARTVAQLAEVSAGSWDGLTHTDIDAQWPGMLDGASAFDWYFRAPDGESYDAAMARVREWLGGLSGTVVAISHGLLSRLIRGAYLGLPREQALELPVPQGVVWHLAKGQLRTIGDPNA